MDRTTISLSIKISATAERIWEAMLADTTYRIWTSCFYEGSYAEGDWSVGGIVYFKSPEGDGLISEVIKHRPADIISFRHIGVLERGAERYEGPEASKWIGAVETYHVEPGHNYCELHIRQDLDKSYMEWFTATWKKALEKLKELAEN